ncbi:Cyclic nucleotide-binding-like protein [Corchorus olitorius]|uniref:Cyclic nucleotide-binding-like protein n=1 Tax=Corchorus olitorius TaxID=93759 RepID=A0A1R3J807_9ROSI|nr:Cyclic nucleotide-binding-like protein [Corchorus olitorius]
MAGEIGVIFNIPQPFTVRTKRLSQVLRISHHHFKQMVQPNSKDGKTIITNFVQPTTRNEDQRNSEALDSKDADPEGTPDTSSPSFSASSIRVIIHGHHPTEGTMSSETLGKLIYLPDSIKELFRVAGITEVLAS